MIRTFLHVILICATMSVYSQTKSESEYQKAIDSKIDQGQAQSALDIEIAGYLKDYPNSANAYLYQGKVLKKLQRFVETLNAFDKSLQINPNQLEANANKADYINSWSIYYRDNKDKFEGWSKDDVFNVVSNGVAAADNAAKNTSDPKWIAAYTFKSADMLSIIGYYEPCITKLNALFQSTQIPEYKYMAMTKLAEVSYETKQLNEAINYALKAIAIDNTKPDAYRTLIPVLYYEQDKNNEAYPHLQKAFDIEDNMGWIEYYYEAIITILQGRRDVNSTLKYSLAMQQKNPQFAKAYVDAAGMYSEQGNNTSFIEMMKKGARLGDQGARDYLKKAGQSW